MVLTLLTILMLAGGAWLLHHPLPIVAPEPRIESSPSPSWPAGRTIEETLNRIEAELERRRERHP